MGLISLSFLSWGSGRRKEHGYPWTASRLLLCGRDDRMDALLFFSFRFLCLPFLPDLFTYTMLLEAWYLHSSVLPLLDRLWSACLVYSLAATYGGGWKGEWMDGMRSMHTPSIQRRRFNTCPSVLDLPGSDVGFLDSQDRTFCISYFFSFPGFFGGPPFPFCQRSRLHFGVGWEWMG